MSVVTRKHPRQMRALARGMDAPKSRCCRTFIYYTDSGSSWCLNCYSELERGWPKKPLDGTSQALLHSRRRYPAVTKRTPARSV